MVQGRCNCEAVSFIIDAELSDVIVCHCSICRRATGSNGIAVLIADNDSFWVGSKAGWDEIGDDGRRHLEAFEG